MTENEQKLFDILMGYNSAYYGYELSKGEIKTILQAFERLKKYSSICTIEEFKALKLKEHNYDNCHNLTCRRKCEKDGYAKAIDEFAERLKADTMAKTFGLRICDIDRIAEEMRGTE